MHATLYLRKILYSNDAQSRNALIELLMNLFTALFGIVVGLANPDASAPIQTTFTRSITPSGCVRIVSPATIGPSRGTFTRFDCIDALRGNILISITYVDGGSSEFMSFVSDTCVDSDGASISVFVQDAFITCGGSVWQYTFDDIRLIPFGPEEESDTDAENAKRMAYKSVKVNANVQWRNFCRCC